MRTYSLVSVRLLDAKPSRRIQGVMCHCGLDRGDAVVISERRRVRLQRVAGLALCLGLGACEVNEPLPLAERSDSAGVEVVRNLATHWTDGEGWTLDSVSSWKLDGEGAAYELSDVTDATVLSDGRVVVLNAGTYEVRTYDTDGHFQTTIGREGDGPGDFRRLANVSEFGVDSILVYDSWIGRATILDSQGDLTRIASLSPEVRVDELLPVRANRLVAQAWSLDDFYDAAGSYRSQYLLLEVDPDGEVIDSIGTFGGWNGFKIDREDGGYTDFAPLIPFAGHMAANGTGIISSSADRPEFVRYSLDGEVVQIVRVPSLAVRLTSSAVDAERAAMIRPESSTTYRDLVNGLPAPEFRPAYGDLLLDSEGFVWTARYRSPRREANEPVLWDVFDPTGNWLGTLRTPARFTAFEVGSDYVIGVRRDDFDVEHVQMLALKR